MKVLVIAPHPDDETLGCGGTLAWHRERGDETHWLILTTMDASFGGARIAEREKEILAVQSILGISAVHKAGLPAATLDRQPMAELVEKTAVVVRAVAPEVVYLPFPGDAHTDHAAAFDAGAACTKWFRFPSVRRVLAYETLSETEFGLRPGDDAFRPNVFVDVSRHLAAKLRAMEAYKGELAAFPFPRSREAIEALARLRGSTAGVQAAEAFMLLKERL